jgi:hypothetical protein
MLGSQVMRWTGGNSALVASVFELRKERWDI